MFFGVVESEGQEKGSSTEVVESFGVFFDFMNTSVDPFGSTDRTGHIPTVHGSEELI